MHHSLILRGSRSLEATDSHSKECVAVRDLDDLKIRL